MQTKTIRKVIEKKITEWINSISDESLRKDLEKNILLSGGSIVSMLLNETVNDYDIYINNPAVLFRLVNYYTTTYSDIEILDGREREKLITDLENQYGGQSILEIKSRRATALRNLKGDQIKLYFNDDAVGKRVNEDIEKEKLFYSPLYFSPNAISLSNQIQIVTRFHGDNEAIHKTFDFIHATNYFTFERGLVTNKEALESILTKQLKYQGSYYPVTSIIRMKKFIKRGWNISAGEILKILFQVSELNLKDMDVLEEQLIGVDIAYFDKLVDILRKVKDDKLTSSYLNATIDKVFDDSEGGFE